MRENVDDAAGEVSLCGRVGFEPAVEMEGGVKVGITGGVRAPSGPDAGSSSMMIGRADEFPKLGRGRPSSRLGRLSKIVAARRARKKGAMPGMGGRRWGCLVWRGDAQEQLDIYSAGRRSCRPEV